MDSERVHVPFFPYRKPQHKETKNGGERADITLRGSEGKKHINPAGTAFLLYYNVATLEIVLCQIFNFPRSIIGVV